MHSLAFWTSRQALLNIGGGLLLTFQLSAQSLPTDVGTTVNGFQDDFEGTSLGTNWVVQGTSNYLVSDGVLHVLPGTGDPDHLLCELPGYDNTVQEVLARIRIVNFGSGNAVYGGVGVGVDGSTGEGIDFVFRNGSSEGQSNQHMAFLDDYVAWGPGLGFAWKTNQWYWVRLRQEPNAASQGSTNDVFAKVWLGDGTVSEPANWQLAWDYTPGVGATRSGFAGITAGCFGALVQFDVDYILIKASGLPPIQVEPNLSPQIVVTDTPFPPAGAAVPALQSIEVQFSPGVSGVTASDLLINNVPAANVTAYSPSLWVFGFPEPAMGTVQVNWAPTQNIWCPAAGTNILVQGNWTYSLNRLALPSSLEISEFMASNKNTLLDEDGDSSDWIEIHNGTGAAVNLWRLVTDR